MTKILKSMITNEVKNKVINWKYIMDLLDIYHIGHSNIVLTDAHTDAQYITIYDIDKTYDLYEFGLILR